VKVENQTGVRTDWRGYAVLPYATEYRENRVALDTNTLADNVDLDDAVVSVVPTHGAIVRASFNAHVGMKLLMTLTHRGKPVPFGALATSDSNQSGSIVADNGQVYLSGMPLAGKVRVKWGDGPDASCVADYRLPPESQQQALSQLSSRAAKEMMMRTPQYLLGALLALVRRWPSLPTAPSPSAAMCAITPARWPASRKISPST
jgi:outer membrane usher protein